MKKSPDISVSLLLIVLGIGIAYEGIRLNIGPINSPEPGFFPFICGILLIIFSTTLLIKSWLKDAPEGLNFKTVRQPAIIIMGLLIYLVIFESLGYIISTFLLSIIVLFVFGTRNLLVMGIASMMTSLGSYLLFDYFLGIRLPQGILRFLIGY